MEVLRRARARDSEESRPQPSQPNATNTACTGGSQRRHRSAPPNPKERFDESELPKSAKTPHVEDLEEMVRKQIGEDKPHPHNGPGSFLLRIFDSPLLEKIMSHRFPNKFIISSFDCYTRATDPIHHLRAYQVKTVFFSHDDYLTCRVCPSSLKAWPWTGSTPSRHDLFETSGKLAMPSLTSTPHNMSLRRTTIIFSPSR